MLTSAIQRGLCKVMMRTADADGGWRMADGGRTKKKKIIEKKNDMKNNKLITEIVGQLMPFKRKLMKINAV